MRMASLGARHLEVASAHVGKEHLLNLGFNLGLTKQILDTQDGSRVVGRLEADAVVGVSLARSGSYLD